MGDDDEADGEIGYIKIFNVGRKVTMHRCTGYVVSKIGFYLSNIHISPRSIFITRPGETKDEAAGKLGSVSVDMTRKGRIYCRNLASFLLSRREEMRNAGDGEGAETLVLMGTTPVHGATLNELSSRGVTASLFPAMSTSLLNELDWGVCIPSSSNWNGSGNRSSLFAKPRCKSASWHTSRVARWKNCLSWKWGLTR